MDECLEEPRKPQNFFPRREYRKKANNKSALQTHVHSLIEIQRSILHHLLGCTLCSRCIDIALRTQYLKVESLRGICKSQHFPPICSQFPEQRCCSTQVGTGNLQKREKKNNQNHFVVQIKGTQLLLTSFFSIFRTSALIIKQRVVHCPT